MDGTTIYMLISFIGILQKSSLYYVDGIHLEAPEMVDWSNAEYTCQKNQCILFKPNKTSLEVSLVSETNFKEDVWVSATSNIISSESASRLSGKDSVLRCEMCKIGTNCGTSCSYKTCGSRCRPLCEHKPNIRVLYDEPKTWIEARQRCLETYNTLGDRIQNVSSLYFYGCCSDECFWTRNLIEVKFQTKTAPNDAEGQCGILQNVTLSFTECNRKLHPLCEIVEIVASTEDPHSKPTSPHLSVTTTALETPQHYFSKLMNTKITYMTTTEDSRRTNRSNSTITKSSTYEASSISNDIVKHTTFGLSEENSSLWIPVEVPMSKNSPEDSPHKSDTGIIIGSVIGSVVFVMMTVVVILCLLRNVMQRTGKRKYKKYRQNTTIRATYKTHVQIYPYTRQNVQKDSRSGHISTARKSKCEGSRSDSVGKTPNPVRSVERLI